MVELLERKILKDNEICKKAIDISQEYSIKNYKSLDIPMKRKEVLVKKCYDISRAADFNVSYEDVRNHLFGGDYEISLLRKDNLIQGFAVFDKFSLENKEFLFLHGIVLNPDTQGKGLAKKMLRENVSNGNYDFMALRTHNPSMYKGAISVIDDYKKVYPNFIDNVPNEIIGISKKIKYFKNLDGEPCDDKLTIRGAYPQDMIQKFLKLNSKKNILINQSFSEEKLGRFDAKAIIINLRWYIIKSAVGGIALKELLEKLIRFKTVYPNYDEIRKCIDFIKLFFEDSGLYVKEYINNREISLVISNCEGKEFDIIFCGHIDVVSAKEELFIQRTDGDKIIARGSSDMKGQIAVMMETMLKTIGNQKKVALFITSDEERGGFNGVKYLLENQKYTSKLAIVPDGGENFDLVTEEKGVMQIKLSCVGKEAHSAYLWDGENSAKRLIAILNKLFETYPEPKDNRDWRTSINMAKFICDTDFNKVPDYAEMLLDIRHINKDSKTSILNTIKNIDERVLIEVLAEGSEFICDEDNLEVINYCKVADKIIGKTINKTKIPSSSDARFFYEKDIPTIIMNPVCGNLHMDDEWVSIQSLEKLKLIYEEYLNY